MSLIISQFYLYKLTKNTIEVNEYSIEVKEQQKWLFEDNPSPYLDGVISPSNRLIVFRKDDDSIVLSRSGGDLEPIDLLKPWKKGTSDKSSTVPREGTVKKCWFNHSGTWIFAYITARQDHHVYAWLVEDVSISQHYVYKVVSIHPLHRRHQLTFFKAEERATEELKGVFPLPGSQRCLIWKSKDKLSILDLKQSGETRKDLTVTGLKAVVVVPNHEEFLFVQQPPPEPWGILGPPQSQKILRSALQKDDSKDGVYITTPVTEGQLEFPLKDERHSVMVDGSRNRVFIGRFWKEDDSRIEVMDLQ
jgi:hypothetical protein